MKIAVLFGTIWCLHAASAAIHSHQYIYTATSGIPNFPEFTAVGSVNGYQISYYDSDMKKMIPKQEWVPGAVDADFWKRNGENLAGTHQTFANNIVVAKERFNQTGGVHTYMFMYGCQWDDETQAIDGFELDGYDGEDFTVLDFKNQRYIPSRSQSQISANKWNSDAALLAFNKQYYTTECLEWLKKYLQYGSSTLGRKVTPEASLFQTDLGVACHATGFYPEAVMITWKKNGQEMDDDVDVGETLPNEDGTFQKRAVLTVSPEERKNAQYSCEVTHKSGEPLILDWKDDNSLPIIIAVCVVAAVILVVVIVAVAKRVIKKRTVKYSEPGGSDTSSDTTPGDLKPEEVHLSAST